MRFLTFLLKNIDKLLAGLVEEGYIILVLKTELKLTVVWAFFFNCTILIVHYKNDVNCYVKVKGIPNKP